MFFKWLMIIICALLLYIDNIKAADVTFKNVVIQGYSMFTHKFNVSVKRSSHLKENLPDKVFDKIEIIDGQIPILYKNSIRDMDNLDELVLNHDEIQEIRPGAFTNVPQLRKLVITNNKLEHIQEAVFNHMNIASLDLNKNLINTISPGAFDDMLELLNVNLADNKLKIWNQRWFANTPLLTRVSFQNNQIEEIPAEAFKNFQGEKQFGSVSLTINILLSHNQIKNVHKDAFKGLKKINNLWLDANNIENWDENLLSGTEVNNLRIDQNKLRCLNAEMDKIFVAKITHIDGNPWDCKCLKNIQVWSSENKRDVIMFYSKLNCDADIIEEKINNLNERLKKLKKNDNLNEVN